MNHIPFIWHLTDISSEIVSAFRPLPIIWVMFHKIQAKTKTAMHEIKASWKGHR